MSLGFWPGRLLGDLLLDSASFKDRYMRLRFRGLGVQGFSGLGFRV